MPLSAGAISVACRSAVPAADLAASVAAVVQEQGDVLPEQEPVDRLQVQADLLRVAPLQADRLRVPRVARRKVQVDVLRVPVVLLHNLLLS
jgi:hypothetical protein